MNRRPQVDTDLGAPEQVRAVARPVATSAPAFSVGQSRGAALAASLSSIAPKLNGYIEELKTDYQESEASRAYDTIQGMTFEEAQQAVQSGQMRDTESPWYQAAFEKQFGMAYAARRKREIVDRYNNEFDKHSGSVDDFLAQFAGEDLDKFGGSEFIMSGYRDGMKGVLETVRNDHAEFKSNWTKERTVENFGQIAQSAIDFALENGDDPMTAVRTLYADHKEAFGMSFGEMDAEVFKLAQLYAEQGNLEAVEQILNYDAVGPDGTKVGSFLTRPKYALDSQTLLETAKANKGKNDREANTGNIVDLRVKASGGALGDADMAHLERLRDDQQITQAQYESILVQNRTAKVAGAGTAYVQAHTEAAKTLALDLLTTGKAYTLQDVEIVNPTTGKKTTLRAKDLIEEQVDASLNVLAAKDATPQQMAQHLASWGVDATYSVWENAMSNGYLALTDALTTVGKDGEVKLPEPALAGYMTWKSLVDTPRLRDRHVTNADAAAIYRDAEVLESVMQVPMEEALLRAAAIDRKGRSTASQSLSRDQIASIVDEAKLWGEDPANGAQVSAAIENSVRVLVDLGLTPEKAVKAAGERFWQSHTMINGAAINTANVFLPPNFEDTSEALLERFAEESGEDIDDLTLLPSTDGSNYWVVAHKSLGGIPVKVNGQTSRFHVTEFQQIEDAAEGSIMDQVNATIQENRDLAQRAEDEFQRWVVEDDNRPRSFFNDK